MSDYVDLSRVTDLEGVMGAQAGAMVAAMLRSMTSAIEQVEAATAAGELDRATRAAHAARNDALMLGARPLQEALTELEVAARAWDAARTDVALERLRAVWPPTRDQLAAVADPT